MAYRPPARAAHNGVVIALRSNIRWCSNHFELACRNGEIVRALFAVDACDREVMAWLATSAGISGEMVRDLNGRLRRASDSGLARRCIPSNGLPKTALHYIAKDTLDTATALGLQLLFHDSPLAEI